MSSFGFLEQRQEPKRKKGKKNTEQTSSLFSRAGMAPAPFPSSPFGIAILYFLGSLPAPSFPLVARHTQDTFHAVLVPSGGHKTQEWEYCSSGRALLPPFSRGITLGEVGEPRSLLQHLFQDVLKKPQKPLSSLFTAFSTHFISRSFFQLLQLPKNPMGREKFLGKLC